VDTGLLKRMVIRCAEGRMAIPTLKSRSHVAMIPDREAHAQMISDREAHAQMLQDAAGFDALTRFVSIY